GTASCLQGHILSCNVFIGLEPPAPPITPLTTVNFLAGSPPSNDPPYTGGRSDENSSGSTSGRGTYSGSYKSIRYEIGLPLTSTIRTSFQSSSDVFSTMAQPCMNNLPFGSSTNRYVVFQIGRSTP